MRDVDRADARSAVRRAAIDNQSLVDGGDSRDVGAEDRIPEGIRRDSSLTCRFQLEQDRHESVDQLSNLGSSLIEVGSLLIHPLGSDVPVWNGNRIATTAGYALSRSKDRPEGMLGPSLNERQSRWDLLTDYSLDQVHTLVCMMDADRRRPLNRCGESV